MPLFLPFSPFLSCVGGLEVCLASYGMETHLGMYAYSACVKAGEGHASPAPAKQSWGDSNWPCNDFLPQAHFCKSEQGKCPATRHADVSSCWLC